MSLEYRVSINKSVIDEQRPAVEKMNDFRMKISAWLIVLAATLAPWAPAADEVSAEAMKSFREGVKAFNVEEYETAVKLFRTAYELNPSWKIFYNIGQCEAALKRYGLAIEAFERYLALGGDEVSADRRDDVLAELSRLRQLVGGVKVRGPDGLAIIVDGVRRGETPLGMAIVVTAGSPHTVRLERAGAVLLEEEITVRGGATYDLDASAVQQSETTNDLEVADQEGPGSEPEKDRLKPALFWIGLGATAAFAGATVGLDFAVGAKIDDAENTADNSALKDSAKKMQVAERVFGGLAVAAAVTSGVLFFLTDFGGEEEPSLAVRPFGDGRSGGLSVQGRF